MTPQRTDIDLEEFRLLLLQERDRLRLLHRQQSGEIKEEMEDAAENELSPVSTFDSAENEDNAVFSAEFDRQSEADDYTRQLLAEVEKALDRLADGTYGLDAVTGEPIPVERLRAIPWATMTVENANRYEE